MTQSFPDGCLRKHCDWGSPGAKENCKCAAAAMRLAKLRGGRCALRSAADQDRLPEVVEVEAAPQVQLVADLLAGIDGVDRSFPDGSLRPWIRRQGLKLAPQRCDGKDLLQNSCHYPPVAACAHRTRPSALLIRRNRPTRHTADARRRRSDRFVSHRQPHPEASARRSRPIRSRIAANSRRGTATSASWKTMYFAWYTTFAPILTNFSRRVVRVQPWIGFGSTSCRSEFARL
jgi:hypothetical protein